MLTITKSSDTWSLAHYDGMEIGGFGETTRQNPEMRWYWSGTGTFGHCATQAEAIAELAKQIPVAIRARDRQVARDVEFAALPAHLQELKAAADSAKVEAAIIFDRKSFNEADWKSAKAVEMQADDAFRAAQNAWLAERRAA